MDSVSPYQSHLNIVKRLRPADGHLRGIIEIGGLGLDNHQQLYAVETTIGQAKKTLTGDHVDHCTEEAVEQLYCNQCGSIGVLKDIATYL